MKELPGRVAAFFDFDRTLVDVDGGVLFGRELMRIYRRRAYADRPGTLGWFGRVVGYHLRMTRLIATGLAARLLYYLRIIKRSTLVNIAYSGLAGLNIDELRLLAQDFVDEVLAHRLYPGARTLMEEHNAKGHLVVIATTNMRLLVEHFKKHLPVDDVIGAELVARDGVATGRVLGPTYGLTKAQAVREYAHARNISLPKSFAYTDHYSDHWFVGLVGNPFVVNPGLRLRRMAKKKGWKELTFLPPRKGSTT
ncbi:MAG: HAD-IB family hydrolase [Euryarchaeota archaeon]|nr:HAD-IB family hydrolase [Euryarchaeota archaeon]